MEMSLPESPGPPTTGHPAALGGGGLAPREVEVTGGGRDAPQLRLHGRAAAVAGARGVELQVSLTHSQDLAAAAVLAVPAARSDK